MTLLKKYLPILSLMAFIQASAQKPYSQGDIVKDFNIESIINKASVSRVSQLQSEITIIDFFGTWCAPCIKALPHLQELQQQFGNRVSILLISTEDKEKLTNFIKSRSSISFPVVVDTDEKITQLFQPASYPYTVVLNKERKILSISNAAALTAESITTLFNTKQTNNTADTAKKETKETKITTPNMPASKRTEYALVKLSQDFMYAAKTGGNSAPLIEQLKNISYNELLTQLNNDNLKKAFWINIYNGFTQYFLKLNHGSYLSRNKFFKANQINIAGKEFSLDNIEHGILRRSKIKWSEGYLNKWFPSTTEKQLRVENLDYRIHFALNCGAESCPPIAFYDDENLNNQLTIATKSYLSSEAKYDTANNRLQLPKLMSWFRHDFGGKQKMLALIQSLNIVPAGKKPSISFKPYSWNLYLDNYKN